jgi:uncharacterized SAM-binding protein YcdF (DUF218 family)
VNSDELLVVLRHLLTALLLPPIGPLLLLILAGLIGVRRPVLGRRLFLLGVVLVVLLAMPMAADFLQWPFEDRTVPVARIVAQPDEAIVVLGSGRNRGALEYGGETVSAATLERVRFAARAAKQTGLPVLVSGGVPGGGSHSEAELMADILKREYGVNVRWIEAKSMNTAENASNSIAILKPDGITRVVLVTDVVHMVRAQYDFQERGMPVAPAAINYRAYHSVSYLDFIPTAEAYARSTYVLRECLGLIWSKFADHPYA